MSHLAQILSDNGHGAVIATPERDAVIKTAHTLLTPSDGGFTKKERLVMSAACMREILNKDTILTTVVDIGADCRRNAWGNILELSSAFFLGEIFVEQVHWLKIDIIIADYANIGKVAKLAGDLNIPLICFSPWSNHYRAKESANYSPLLATEPSHMCPHFSVTGYLQAYINYFKFRGYAELRDVVDVFLVNDVTYFSYQ